jgi:hypothetical protein
MKIDVIGTATSGASLPVNLLRIMARQWRRQTSRLSNPYRPERHYMRGPGPKCREKQDLTVSAVQ